MAHPFEIGRTAGAALLVAALGCGLLWQLTDGLSTFTSEAWRRAQIERQPRPLPDTVLQDEIGQIFRLRDLCGQVVVLDFVYTRCPSVCKALGAGSSQLARWLVETGQQATVLSISFDPLNDTPTQLAAFKRGLEPQPSAWRVARPLNLAERDDLLNVAGVVVIPDGAGGFEHNAALHIVDKTCRITRLLDLEDLDHARRTVQALL